MRVCPFLGHMVGDGQIRPMLAKTEAVRTFTTPRTKKQVRAFLGLAGYYRRFVPKFSLITAPLSDLTKKHHPDKVQWSEEAASAFQQTKDALQKIPVLRCPPWEEPFILQTDASGLGVAAVLSQGVGDEEHAVAFYSRKLLPAEKNYSAVEQECLAVVCGVKHFDVYLSGQEFRIETDNRALVYLKNFKEKNSILTRWALAVQPYQFVIAHRAGMLNDNADGLSCQYPDHPGGGESVRDSAPEPLTAMRTFDQPLI